MAEPAHLLPMPTTSARTLPGLSLVKAPPDSKVGTPVRVLLLVVGVAVLFLALKMFVLGAPASVPLDADVVPHVVKPVTQQAAAGAVDPAGAIAAAAQTAAAANARIGAPNAAATPDAPAAPATRPPAAKAAAPAVQLDSGLPKPLAAALRRSPVAVVSLYAPDSKVAGIARLEAAAGAVAGGAPYVGVDVHRQAQVAPFTGLLGVMSDPTVLVFQRPGKVFVRLDGYVDRDTIAQAVMNAKVAVATAPAVAPAPAPAPVPAPAVQ
jgi:hypothetical protein